MQSNEYKKKKVINKKQFIVNFFKQQWHKYFHLMLYLQHD